MKTYGTTPVATDLFIDTKRYPDRWLTTEEQVASVRQDIDIAVRLGASIIRAIINTLSTESSTAIRPPPEDTGGAKCRVYTDLDFRLIVGDMLARLRLHERQRP